MYYTHESHVTDIIIYSYIFSSRAAALECQEMPRSNDLFDASVDTDCGTILSRISLPDSSLTQSFRQLP